MKLNVKEHCEGRKAVRSRGGGGGGGGGSGGKRQGNGPKAGRKGNAMYQ